MLFSNWDNKDARVGVAGGPNTAIFELRTPAAAQYIYAFTDWGSGMGALGSLSQRSDSRCAEFSAQSSRFVRKVESGRVLFRYAGDINPGFQTGIPAAHVAWLVRFWAALRMRNCGLG